MYLEGLEMIAVPVDIDTMARPRTEALRDSFDSKPLLLKGDANSA